VDKTALHISKSPTPLLLEAKIREHQKTDPKFSFLSDDDAYHQYYRFMIEKVREDAEDGTAAVQAQAAAAKPVEVEKAKLQEPRLLEFVVDMPSVTAEDLWVRYTHSAR
jgi:splicing factor 3A subunit 1